MEENICMEQLPKDGKKLEEALEQGKLVVTRVADDFLYFLDGGDVYRMFSHSAGKPQAGRRMQPKDERMPEMLAALAQEADALFSVEFDPAMDIPTVLYSAEEAILETFPMVGDGDKIDFTAENPLDPS